MSNLMKFMFALLLSLFAIATIFTISSHADATPVAMTQIVNVYHPDAEKTFAVNNDLFTFKAYTSTNSNNTSDFFTVEITTSAHSNPGGFQLQKHLVNTPEDFYIQAEDFEFFSFQPNKSIKVSTGDILHIPAGVPYGYKNIGSESGKILLVSSSPGLKNFVAEIGTPVANLTSTPASSVQTDINKIASIAHN